VAGRAYLDLQALSVREERDTAETLALYALEGIVDRISASGRAGDLVLKGGVLLAAYDTRRPTRDVDVHAAATSNDVEAVLALVREIAAMLRRSSPLCSAGPRALAGATSATSAC
jgi:hypothetical protein